MIFTKAQAHIHQGLTAAFWRAVPCYDAIKNITKSGLNSISSWWYGLRGQRAKKRRSVPEHGNHTVRKTQL